MNNTANPSAKRCINKVCRKTDLTDFSTCKYCGFAYDHLPARFNQSQTGRKSIFENPMPLIRVGIAVGSIVATLYLTSVFGTHHSGVSGYRSGRVNASIPAAFVVFFSQKMLAKADQDIQSASATLASDPKNYDAYIKRGDAYWTKTLMNDALTDYTSAIAINPNGADAYDKRANIYDAMTSYDLAKKDRDKAASLRK